MSKPPYWKPSALANKSAWDDAKPTIIIHSHESGWDEAWIKYIAGKNPTDSKEWKQGICCYFESTKFKAPIGVYFGRMG